MIQPDRQPPISISADAGAQHSNLAEFSTEQTGKHAPKQKYNIWLLFKIKHSQMAQWINHFCQHADLDFQQEGKGNLTLSISPKFKYF